MNESGTQIVFEPGLAPDQRRIVTDIGGVKLEQPIVLLPGEKLCAVEFVDVPSGFAPGELVYDGRSRDKRDPRKVTFHFTFTPPAVPVCTPAPAPA